jgi:hypothetical protein
VEVIPNWCTVLFKRILLFQFCELDLKYILLIIKSPNYNIWSIELDFHIIMYLLTIYLFISVHSRKIWSFGNITYSKTYRILMFRWCCCVLCFVLCKEVRLVLSVKDYLLAIWLLAWASVQIGFRFRFRFRPISLLVEMLLAVCL